MRVLLDESMPRRFGEYLVGHDAPTVQEMGRASMGDGGLLRWAAEARFDLLVTMDRSLPFQQWVDRSMIGVIVLVAVSNRMTDLVPLVPEVVSAMASIRPGEVIHVPAVPRSRRPTRR